MGNKKYTTIAVFLLTVLVLILLLFILLFFNHSTNQNVKVTENDLAVSNSTEGVYLNLDDINNEGVVFLSKSKLLTLPIGNEGQVLKVSNGLPTWANEKDLPVYNAGSGLSFNGNTFFLDLNSSNTWTGTQYFNGGFSLGGNVYTSLNGNGLSYSNGTLFAVLGNSIESSEILDGTITGNDIANSTITLNKISQNGCSVNEVIKWNGISWACGIDLDTNTIYNASGNGLELIGNTFALELDGTTLSISSNGLKVNSITSSEIANNTIVDQNISPTANIALSKLASGLPGQIIVGNTGGTPSYVTLSGDATINSSGVITISNDSVALGTDTTGNYVAGATPNSGLVMTGTEGGTLGILLDGTTLNINSSD